MFLFKSLKAELNPICHPQALLGAYHILHVSRVRVNCRSFNGAYLSRYIALNGGVNSE